MDIGTESPIAKDERKVEEILKEVEELRVRLTGKDEMVGRLQGLIQRCHSTVLDKGCKPSCEP